MTNYEKLWKIMKIMKNYEKLGKKYKKIWKIREKI